MEKSLENGMHDDKSSSLSNFGHRLSWPKIQIVYISCIKTRQESGNCYRCESWRGKVEDGDVTSQEDGDVTSHIGRS